MPDRCAVPHSDREESRQQVVVRSEGAVGLPRVHPRLHGYEPVKLCHL